MYNPFYNSKNQYFTSGEQTPFPQNSQQMTPLPPEREPTIMELLEQNWQRQQNQQSQIPQPAFRSQSAIGAQPVEPDYSNMSLSEELTARADYMKNQQGIKLPDSWLGSSIKTKEMTPVPDNLNQTTFTPQQLTSSPLPPYFPHMPRMLPKQQTEECSYDNWEVKLNELNYMNKVPKVLTTGNNLADKMVEKALWKVLQTMMVTPQGKLLGIAAEKVYPYMEDVGHYTAQGISAFNEVCSNKK